MKELTPTLTSFWWYEEEEEEETDQQIRKNQAVSPDLREHPERVLR